MIIPNLDRCVHRTTINIVYPEQGMTVKPPFWEEGTKFKSHKATRRTHQDVLHNTLLAGFLFMKGRDVKMKDWIERSNVMVEVQELLQRH